MPVNHLPLPRLMLPLLLMLVSGCAQLSPPPAAVVPPPRVPPLPAEARQPAPPPICSPTCSAGLTRLRTELLGTLTHPASPGAPASAPTKP